MRSLLLAPPTELAGGRYAAPGWVILALGALVSIGALVYLGVRYWLVRDAKRTEERSLDSKEKR